MKLSDHVALLNLLDTIDISAERVEAIRSLAAVLQQITGYSLQVGDYSQRLQDNFLSIRSGIDQFTETVNALRDHVTTMIAQADSTYLQNSIRIYQSEMIHERPDYILNRRLTAQGDDLAYISGRLKLLGDWRYPGMCIRPGLEDFVKIMVPLDPLYIVDQEYTLLEPAVQNFGPQYQRRLRQYTINDYRSDPILKELPDNQFGVIFAYNFFNYKPLMVIERYLSEMYRKLRPGGTVIMTFNNCDRAHAVGLAERNFMMYTPLRLLRPIIEQIGYTNISNRQCDGDFDLLELVKPGELSSIRGGQCLAKIFADS
jgi:SAM-dependent methyltransferase